MRRWRHTMIEWPTQGKQSRVKSMPFLPQSPFLPAVDDLHPAWTPSPPGHPCPSMVDTNSSQLTQKAGQPPSVPTLSPGGANSGRNSCSKAPGGVSLSQTPAETTCMSAFSPLHWTLLPCSSAWEHPSPNKYMHTNLSLRLFLGSWIQDASLLLSHTLPSTRYSYPISSPVL